MTKEHAYAYEAGYRDGSIHYELEHCPACKNVADLQEALEENAKLREELADAPKCDACEAMLDCDECLRADGSHKERRRLSAENAKLREQLEYALQTSRARLETIDRLKAENAKLREYAKLMHTHIKVCCDACGECGFCDIDALTRELGIEVPL